MLNKETTPSRIVKYLDQYVIGQDEAKKIVSVAVYSHYRKISTVLQNSGSIAKSNVLLIGSSGTGKTLLCETLSHMLGVPFVTADATSLAQTKYVNEEIEAVLQRLLDKANGDLRKAQLGIVFIDEIDKVAARQETSGADVSRQGVQRDLLPLVEGTTVSTKYGMVKTDHILFIASGAFHLSKPSDLIPELQGRFPIRVELESLSVQDFEGILTQTHASLVKQYQALLATEGVALEFVPEGITRLAHIAFEVNERTENIGARRLSTVMERLLDEVSFDAAHRAGQTLVVDAAYVDERLKALSQDEDLSRYIL